ncbi:MAG TPA: NlpC/P60 family protein [Deinococcales bacterium]|nr:NlpC/P60 family protein [Deinococcales bacterium]
MSDLQLRLDDLQLDARHDLLDVHVSGRLLTGLAEVGFREQLLGLAAELELEPAVRFVLPRPGVARRRAALLGAPAASAAQVNEVLLGDPVEVLHDRDGFSLVRTMADDYLGWLRRELIVPGHYPVTHTVTALRAHAYAGPRVQAERLADLSWGVQLQVRSRGGDWAHVLLPGGQDAFVHARALVEGSPGPDTDFAASCTRLLHAPYIWGGNTAWGLDCSGLAQLVHAMAGAQLPRDADEQFAAGTPVEPDEARPGDAACYTGHIGIITGPETMIHATGRTMDVREDHIFATQGLKEAFLGVVRFG